MKKYNWKKMEAHARNYDGTCSCCGGWCTEDDVAEMLLHAEADMIDCYNWYSKHPESKSAYRRYNYLKKRLDNCCTYRFVD